LEQAGVDAAHLYSNLLPLNNESLCLGSKDGRKGGVSGNKIHPVLFVAASLLAGDS
jgi:hypothetical protein